MSTKSPRVHNVSRQAFWQRHVTQWGTTELSKAAYCQQHALTYHQMVYWCTKLESSDESEVRSGGFVAVTVSSPGVCASGAGNSGLSIRLPNGVTIEGINDQSIELVNRLIAQL